MKRVLSAMLVLAMMAALLTGCGHEHAFGEWEVKTPATCVQSGAMLRTCECGEAESSTIAPVAHTYESLQTRSPGCTETGEMTYTCTGCGDSYAESIEPKELPATEVYEKTKNAVGAVSIYDKNGKSLGLGSCFAYEKDKLITNYHVIEEASYLKITFGEDTDTYLVNKVLAYDKTIDVAILQIDGVDVQPIPLCKQDHAVGSAVYALGNSKGLEATFSEGIITTARREADGVIHVQHDAPISGGNSGGPLINAYGEAIGINAFVYRDSQNLNFAIHMSELDKLDFNTVMTLDEVTEKECSAFAKISAYVMENGSYSDGNYYLSVYSDEMESDSGLLVCEMAATYEPGSDEFWLFYMLNESYTLGLVIDEDLSGNYGWIYGDDDDVTMIGYVDAATFTADTLLSYDSVENPTDDSTETIQTLASVMMWLICIDVETAFADIGVTGYDLGFTAVEY